MITEKQITDITDQLIIVFEGILKKNGFNKSNLLTKNYYNGKFVEYKNDIIQTYWSGFIIGRQSVLENFYKK